MLICFIGDVHGHVFEALAAVVQWQRAISRRFDLIIQLGDFGVLYDTTDGSQFPGGSYESLDPGQFDLTRLVRAGDDLAETLHLLRSELNGPVKFVLGNHDDPSALSSWIDPFELFEHLPDGTVLRAQEISVAAAGSRAGRDLEPKVVENLLARRPRVDILASHAPPFGVARGFHGDTQGSWDVTRLLVGLEPRFCIAGDLHHLIGPLTLGPTSYVGLAAVVSGRWHTFAGVAPGSLASLDTTTEELTVCDADWLRWIGGFGVSFDLTTWWSETMRGRSGDGLNE